MKPFSNLPEPPDLLDYTTGELVWWLVDRGYCDMGLAHQHSRMPLEQLEGRLCQSLAPLIKNLENWLLLYETGRIKIASNYDEATVESVVQNTRDLINLLGPPEENLDEEEEAMVF